MTIRNTACLALGLATLLATAVPAARAEDVQTTYARIDARQYRLNTEPGRAALRHRIEQVVREVCGTADYNNFGTVVDMKHCRDDARVVAMSQMDIAVAAARTRPSAASAEVASSDPIR